MRGINNESITPMQVRPLPRVHPLQGYCDNLGLGLSRISARLIPAFLFNVLLRTDKMKSNTLKLVPCYIVTSWAKNIINAIGVQLEIIEYCMSSSKVLVKTDKGYQLHRSSEVYFALHKAELALKKEKESYLAFLNKQVKEYSEAIAELS